MNNVEKAGLCWFILGATGIHYSHTGGIMELFFMVVGSGLMFLGSNKTNLQ